MTRIEERLREDLPALADALVAAPSSTPASDAPEPGSGPIALEAARRRRTWSTRLTVAVAAAAVVVVAGIALGANWDSDTALDTADRTAAPTSFGVWRPLPEAPISSRSYPVSVWTGTEALFWGGSSLDRGFAYTEAVAYDPNAGSWRDVVEPGWGHPGAKGVAVNGELFVVAKGSGARFDFETEAWSALPPVEGMFFTGVVASEDAVWGLGPALEDLEGQPDLAIVRYDADADQWMPGPTFEGTDDTAGIIDSARDIDRPAVWTGDAIVVWDGQRGLAFDPDKQAWTLLPRLAPPGGDIVRSEAVPSADGLSVVAELALDGQRTTGLARLEAGRWSWRATDLPAVDLGNATVSGAGSWVVLLPAEAPPITVHLPSGAWHEHGDAPLQGVQGPGTVWTGSQLIVWGGAHHVSSSPEPATGMAWTPPPLNTSEGDGDQEVTPAPAETDRPARSGADCPGLRSETVWHHTVAPGEFVPEAGGTANYQETVTNTGSETCSIVFSPCGAPGELYTADGELVPGNMGACPAIGVEPEDLPPGESRTETWTVALTAPPGDYELRVPQRDRTVATLPITLQDNTPQCPPGTVELRDEPAYEQLVLRGEETRPQLMFGVDADGPCTIRIARTTLTLRPADNPDAAQTEIVDNQRRWHLASQDAGVMFKPTIGPIDFPPARYEATVTVKLDSGETFTHPARLLVGE